MRGLVLHSCSCGRRKRAHTHTQRGLRRHTKLDEKRIPSEAVDAGTLWLASSASEPCNQKSTGATHDTCLGAPSCKLQRVCDADLGVQPSLPAAIRVENGRPATNSNKLGRVECATTCVYFLLSE